MVDGIRLSLIDDSNRDDHFHLTAEDTCYYLFEYTSGRNYAFSATNGLISNLKKKPSQAAQSGYHHKRRAIGECARCLTATLNPEWLRHATLVPIPGSKARGHVDFDDRVEQICNSITNPAPDVRNLVIQTVSIAASHEVSQGNRVTVDQLLSVYAIDEAEAVPAPNAIGVVDDVLTAGTHYRAMHRVLSRRFPGVPIAGIFIARRVFPDDPCEPPRM